MSSMSYTLRGVNSTTGTYTWDITGFAVATPGNYADIWVLKNNRSPLDVLLDLTLNVTQQITITAQQVSNLSKSDSLHCEAVGTQVVK